MNNKLIVLSPDLYFSYGQFFVYDKELTNPATEWSPDHTRQGFARRERAIAVGTLLEFGFATVTVGLDLPNPLTSYERVLALPLELRSGLLAVDGPEEHPIARWCPAAPGYYRVLIAQRTIEDEREDIAISLERLATRLDRSEVLIADDALDPPTPLIETACAVS
jgi:hypothetical protein